MTSPDWQREQLRLNHVVQMIDKRLADLQEKMGQIRSEVVHIRRHFGDDVTVNLDSEDEAIETLASIRQQNEVLSERERSHRLAHNQWRTLHRLKPSPYFGRIDFSEDGRGTESLYIGIASLLDEHDDQFLIYDWRSPVASLYYDYGPGPAQYDTPGGTVSGVMELKRQFIIRDGRITNMFDTGVTIGDELLKEVLGKHSDTQMKNIVATIQREQNRIIRNESSPLLIVQGAAGSGKTSAALQRVAYLLYRYRTSLTADQIVLFSPNPLFNSYVSTVLPELGEENMQQTTFQEYLERRLGDACKVEDPFSQLEYVHTAMDEPGYHARLAGIRFKSSETFLQVIDRYLEHLGRQGMRFRDLVFRGKVIIPAGRIATEFYALDSSIRIPNRLEMIARWLLEELRVRSHEERHKPWVEDAIECLDRDTYARVTEELRIRKRLGGRTFDDYDLERKLLAEWVVRRRMKPLLTAVKRLAFADVTAVYRQLFEDPALIREWTSPAQLPDPDELLEICTQTRYRLDRSELAYEDATPYLYLHERIKGFHTSTSVRHVFVDEAQDYSTLQLAFLRRLFPNSRFTLLGDANQGILAQAEGTDFALAARILGAEQAETIRLTKSYRSVRPIVELTRRLIPDGDTIEPFQREGRLPTLTRVNDHGQLSSRVCGRIRELLAAGHRTIAVIGKTARETRQAYERLRAHLPLRLIDKETDSFTPGVLAIPVYLAKGVEFDAVIIYNASREQYGRESERRLFYTACTRAMHELHLFSLGEISPFLAQLPHGLYETV